MLQSPGNPFSSVKQIETSQELLDIAFHKSMKIKPPGGKMHPMDRSKTHEINRINTVANVLTSRLERIVKQFPSLNLIHPFYLDLSAVLIDVDRLRLALGRIYGMIRFVRDVELEIVNNIHEAGSKAQNKTLRKGAFGRFASMMHKLQPYLRFLEKVRIALTPLPSFNPFLPSIVVCGVPNTGKSSFVRLTTSGKPDVASYPFTTKKLIFGHRKFGFLDVQFVDTPGLLDRPLAKRNEIELQALTALKHLSDVMVYLVDPSISASSTIDQQINLLKEIHKFYSSISFLTVISKNDLASKEDLSKIIEQIIDETGLELDTILTINSKNLNGVEPLLDKIERLIKKEVISSPKFKQLTSPEIAEDQLPSEDDPMWIDKEEYDHDWTDEVF